MVKHQLVYSMLQKEMYRIVQIFLVVKFCKTGYFIIAEYFRNFVFQIYCRFNRRSPRRKSMAATGIPSYIGKFLRLNF